MARTCPLTCGLFAAVAGLGVLAVVRGKRAKQLARFRWRINVVP